MGGEECGLRGGIARGQAGNFFQLRVKFFSVGVTAGLVPTWENRYQRPSGLLGTDA